MVEKQQRQPSVVNKKAPIPPLLKHFMLQQMAEEGKSFQELPELDLVVQSKPRNNVAVDWMCGCLCLSDQ